MLSDRRTPALSFPCTAAIVCVLTLIIAPAALAADAEIEAYMGDTVTISGVSYTSDEMYLFMVGEDLDPNGVTLTDTGARTSEGEFTIVDVNSDQTWSYRWDTSRLTREIDPGVFTIYASTEPVDLAHLGGSSTYKTVEVWLKDPDSSVRITGGASYTLNPERHVSTQDRTLVFTASPTPTTVTTTIAMAVPSTVDTTAASTLPATQSVTMTQQAGLPLPGTLLVLITGIAASLFLVQRRPGNK
ncbi:MAG TPA: hypothetical protein P5217_06195 [Methanoregulaceae archaeon]|nr:hypothetical protein [Methanoregulaceae archaeon]HPD76511.1 hypothetical protein [Methanoregulaceae archaeon]HRY75854.1 hypothetical protein [Methanoregulaceae archaeon]